MSWWVTVPGGHPLGPVRTENLLQAIAVGRVPHHALVCRVGDEEWSPLASIQRFAEALGAVERRGSTGSQGRARYAEPETVEPRAQRSGVPPLP